MSEFQLLIITVLSISAVHTFSGPDHYLPFIVLSRSKKWSLKKTLFWTSLCGIAHVLSSAVLGVFGIFLGWSIKKTFHIENRDIIIAKVKKYNEENREHRKEYCKKYRQEHKEEYNAYREANKDKINQKRRERRALANQFLT
jgi:hypothetical protein